LQDGLYMLLQHTEATEMLLCQYQLHLRQLHDSSTCGTREHRCHQLSLLKLVCVVVLLNRASDAVTPQTTILL
jgi:hypothetical protein